MGSVTSQVPEASSVSYQSICGGSSEEHRTDIFKDDSNHYSWPLSPLPVREILGQIVPILPQISAADWYSIGQGENLLKCSDFWCYPKNTVEYSDCGKDSELDLIQHYVITREEN